MRNRVSRARGQSTRPYRPRSITRGRQFLVGNWFLLCSIFVFQITLAACAQQARPAIASSQSPHGPLKTTCEKCHTVSSWWPIRSKPEFNHNKTGFPLRGLHTDVPCQECHVNPMFSNIGTNCQDCHADIHRRRNGAQCDMCHRMNGWQVTVHDMNEHQDRFPLIGAHAVADCYSCHKAGAIGEFNRQGLSTECVSCHLKVFQKASAPNHVALGYSTECEECHTSFDSWTAGAVSGMSLRKRK